MRWQEELGTTREDHYLTISIDLKVKGEAGGILREVAEESMSPSLYLRRGVGILVIPGALGGECGGRTSGVTGGVVRIKPLVHL